MLNFVYHETDKNPNDPTPQNVVPNIINEGYGLGIVINYLNSLANYSHTGETFKSVNKIVEKYI